MKIYSAGLATNTLEVSPVVSGLGEVSGEIAAIFLPTQANAFARLVSIGIEADGIASTCFDGGGRLPHNAVPNGRTAGIDSGAQFIGAGIQGDTTC